MGTLSRVSFAAAIRKRICSRFIGVASRFSTAGAFTRLATFSVKIRSSRTPY